MIEEYQYYIGVLPLRNKNKVTNDNLNPESNMPNDTEVPTVGGNKYMLLFIFSIFS